MSDTPRPHPDEGRADHEAIRGSGLPATSARNAEGKCTGVWAGHSFDDSRHCVCWWDESGSCCQCDQPSTERVSSSRVPWKAER